jgi:beta-lactamase superfamily II metal-dependent hydrolase
MQIEIFDVGHGQCACITTLNGRQVLIDCGHRTEPYWWPSIHFRGANPDALVVTNLDEDHISDFGDFVRDAAPRLIFTNPSVGRTELALMKPDGMGTGTRSFHQWLSQLPAGPGVGSPLPDLGGVVIEHFFNRFGDPFFDTNNLSLVTVVSYGGFAILFPGDLERAGWARLLTDQPRLRWWLPQINVFVTSHHGRDNGCSDDLFKNCSPQLFVISDDVMQHGTQETGDWYRNRATGAKVQRWRAAAGVLGHLQPQSEQRFVVTTRNDKSMRLQVQSNGDWGCMIGIDHARV